MWVRDTTLVCAILHASALSNVLFWFICFSSSVRVLAALSLKTVQKWAQCIKVNRTITCKWGRTIRSRKSLINFCYIFDIFIFCCHRNGKVAIPDKIMLKRNVTDSQSVRYFVIRVMTVQWFRILSLARLHDFFFWPHVGHVHKKF